MSDDNSTERRLVRIANCLLWGGGIVLVLTLLLYRYGLPYGRNGIAEPLPLAGESDAWGQFGDFVAGLGGTLVSFLALIAVVLAVRFQHRELKEARKGLEAQAKSSRISNWASAFYYLLEHLKTTTEEVVHHNARGREAFRQCYVALKNQMDLELRVGNYSGANLRDTGVRAIVRRHIHENWSIDHYFATLFHVFKYIDESELSEQDKVFYSNLARSQLSTYEVLLLFYNCTTDPGETFFRPLVVEFGLLKHVDVTKLVHGEEDKSFYEESAFAGWSRRQEIKRSRRQYRAGKPG